MSHQHQHKLSSRNLNRLRHTNSVARARSASRRVALSKRARGEQNQRLPFVPPEDWHEPLENGKDYRILIQDPGPGYRHILTPQEIRERLAQVPSRFLETLEVVQLSRMTRKKQSFPCYGMQWGSSLYLYPIEENLVEYYHSPPKPNQITEARMFGGRWMQDGPGMWKLVWSEAAIKDFYLNNILMHELGHLLDDRNSRSVDRERYAEWFAIHYGYRATQRLDYRATRQTVRRRHAAKV